jgi:hypothetical protein
MLYNEDSKLKEGMTVTLIKKIALFTGLAVMILALSGCSFAENFTFQGEDYALESSMIESRTLLRRANVGLMLNTNKTGHFLITRVNRREVALFSLKMIPIITH